MNPIFSTTLDTEGYALEWNVNNISLGLNSNISNVDSMLATGNNSGNLYVYKVGDSSVDNIIAMKCHDGSLEDIQWCPDNHNVLATCGSDG